MFVTCKPFILKYNKLVYSEGLPHEK